MANNDSNLLKKIIAHAKEYGFIFPSSEIYDGLSATYDYGQNGVELKNNIRKYWWQAMVQMNENIVGIDAAIFMHPTTWKASGHVDAFNDPLIDNKDSKKRYRADVLLEDHIAKIEGKIDKEVTKAAKRFGDDFDKEQFLATNGRVLQNLEKIDNINKKMKEAFDASDLAAIKALIEELEIACPVSGSRNWTDVRQFNLMFSTDLGSVSGESSNIYLRPETAQGIFVNYLNVQKTGRMKLPFGIAQTGKAFRNEIIARQFIFRISFLTEDIVHVLKRFQATTTCTHRCTGSQQMRRRHVFHSVNMNERFLNHSNSLTSDLFPHARPEQWPVAFVFQLIHSGYRVDVEARFHLYHRPA